MFESNDIRTLTWFAWRLGALEAVSKSFGTSAAVSFERFTHCNETLNRAGLPRFLEENEPRLGEFLIECWDDDSSDKVVLVSTSQRMWLLDLDQDCLVEFELAKLTGVDWKARLTHAVVLIETADGETKSLRATMAPDAKAVNHAIRKCREQPWAICIDEETKALFADDIAEPDPDPIGIGVSASLDSLVGRIASDEEWLCLGLATWTTLGTEATTVFFKWVNRAFLGVIGDAVTHQHRKCGIVAVSRSGGFYIVNLGNFIDSDPELEVSDALEVLVPEATLDPASAIQANIADISVSWKKNCLVVNFENESLPLSFPSCSIPNNERLGAQLEHIVSASWKYK